MNLERLKKLCETKKTDAQNSEYFNILAFSDWRTQSYEELVKYLDIIPKVDLIIYAGDDLAKLEEFGVEQLVSKSKYGLAGIAGNDDIVHFKDIAKECAQVYDIHQSPIILEDYAFIGLEGTTKGPGLILHDENEVINHLNQQYERIFSERIIKTILVSHTPPFGILDFSMRFGKDNIGSSSLKEFLDSKKIDYVICGHSHLNGGTAERYNKTCVFNVSSHDDKFAPGKILFLRINKSKINFRFHQIESFQKIKSDISILKDVGRKTYTRMFEKGITKLEDINEGNRSLLKTIPGVYDAHVDYWLMQIKAIRQDKVHIIKNELTEILQKNEIICYDIETNLENDRIWLIGYYNFQTNEFGSIFEKDKELNCLKRFLQYLEKYNNFKLISFSNCTFENRIITKRAEYYNLKELLLIIKDEIDLGIRIPHILTGNIGYYNLKYLGNYFGYRWENPEIDGKEVGIAYSQYLKTKKEMDWEKYIKYNKDDVFALKEIIMRIRELLKTDQTQS